MEKSLTVIMTTKGQITVPKEIRDKFNLAEGSKLKIIYNNEEIIFRPITIADEFEELILADLAREGVTGYELEKRILVKKAQIENTFDEIIKKRKAEGYVNLEDSNAFEDCDK